MINIDNKYDIGQTVYLITDEERMARIVFAIIITKGDLIYELACGTTTSKHYDFELVDEKPVLV